MKKFFFLLCSCIFLSQAYGLSGTGKKYDLRKYTCALLRVTNATASHCPYPWAAKLYTEPKAVGKLKQVFKDFESDHLCPKAWSVTFFNEKGETEMFRISDECETHLKQDVDFWKGFKTDMDSTCKNPMQAICQVQVPSKLSPAKLLEAFKSEPRMHILFYDSELDRLPSATVRFQFTLDATNKSQQDTARKLLDACIFRLPKKFKVAGSRLMVRSSNPGTAKSIYVYEGTIYFEYGQDLEGITSGTAPVELLHCALPSEYIITLQCDNLPVAELQARARKALPSLMLFWEIQN